MKVSVPNLESEVTVQQKRQTEGQPINNAENKMMKNSRQDKIIFTDITKNQWFWDKAVLS